MPFSDSGQETVTLLRSMNSQNGSLSMALRGAGFGVEFSSDALTLATTKTADLCPHRFALCPLWLGLFDVVHYRNWWH